MDYYKRGDNYLIAFILGYLIMQSLNNLAFVLSLDGALWDFFSKGFLALLLGFSLIVMIKRIPLIMLVSEVLLSILFMLAYFFSKVPESFNSIVYNAVFVYLPLGLACLAIHNNDRLYRGLYYAAFPIELFTIIASINMSSIQYSMSAGYIILLPLLIHLDSALSHHRITDFIFIIVDLIIIVFFCSRGPLLCVIFFLLYEYLFLRDSHTIVKVTVSSVILVSAFYAVLFYQNIIDFLSNRLNLLGLNSRTIRLLLEGNISYDSDRLDIYRYYWQAIIKSPLLGYGLTGNWFYSSYPHNLVLEILSAFGVILGPVILFVLFYSWHFGIHQKDLTAQRLSIIFVSFAISLFWSGSFIMTPTFFVCLAVCIKYHQVLAVQRIKQ